MVFVYIATTFGGLPRLSDWLETNSPSHVWTPNETTLIAWAEFAISIGTHRALFPDFIQRTMAARSQESMRRGFMILACAPLFIQGPLMFVGLIAAERHPGLENTKSSFTKVVLDVIDHNGFGYFFGSITMAASIAGIMSTCDSVLIVTAQLINLDIIKPIASIFTGEELDKKKTLMVGWVVTIMVAII